MSERPQESGDPRPRYPIGKPVRRGRRPRMMEANAARRLTARNCRWVTGHGPTNSHDSNPFLQGSASMRSALPRHAPVPDLTETQPRPMCRTVPTARRADFARRERGRQWLTADVPGLWIERGDVGLVVDGDHHSTTRHCSRLRTRSRATTGRWNATACDARDDGSLLATLRRARR